MFGERGAELLDVVRGVVEPVRSLPRAAHGVARSLLRDHPPPGVEDGTDARPRPGSHGRARVQHGGAIAQELARRHPDLLEGLVLIATAAQWRTAPQLRALWTAMGALQLGAAAGAAADLVGDGPRPLWRRATVGQAIGAVAPRAARRARGPVVHDPGGVLRGAPLRAGASGLLVAEVQRLLCLIGDSPGQVDGVFGPATTAAVRRFQRAQRMTADGIVDAATWRSLHRIDRAGRRPAPDHRPVAGEAGEQAGRLAIAERRSGGGARVPYAAVAGAADGGAACSRRATARQVVEQYRPRPSLGCLRRSKRLRQTAHVSRRRGRRGWTRLGASATVAARARSSVEGTSANRRSSMVHTMSRRALALFGHGDIKPARPIWGDAHATVESSPRYGLSAPCRVRGQAPGSSPGPGERWARTPASVVGGAGRHYRPGISATRSCSPVAAATTRARHRTPSPQVVAVG